MSNSAATAEPAPAPLTAPAHITARLKVLPPCARAKYEKLRRASQRARAIVDGLQIEIDRVREQRASAMGDLGIHDRHSHRDPADDPARPELVAAVDAATAELARLQEEARAVIVPNIAAIETWLANEGASGKYVPAIFPTAKVGRNETSAAVLARIQEDQRRIADELAAVQSAPRTVAEAKAAMRDELAVLAARGRPVVDGLFTGHGVEWPTEQFIAGGHGAHQYNVAATVKDTFALLVWAHQDAIAARLEAEIEAQSSDDADALSADDQAARVQELEAKLVVLQRQAESIIERLEGDGVSVRRECGTPEIVLGIARA